MAISSYASKTNSHLPSPSKTLLTKQAMQDYVYFSDNTKGHTGKAVKIKIDLFPRFAALVDPKTHTGQTVIRQIENLRMTNGATSGVHANINSAFRFMLKVENMQVFYAVLDGEEQGKKEVFIGDIKAQFEEGNEKAGLHVFDALSRRYKSYKQTNLDGKLVYLNGQEKSFDAALRSAQSRVPSSDANLAVFYVPGKVVNDLGVWSSVTASQLVKETVNLLRDAMKFNQGKKVGWIAEAEGAEVFSSALDEIKGSLTGHRFRLIDPITNTPMLLEKLKVKEIKPVNADVAPVMYTSQNRATNMYMESQKQAVINALRMLRVQSTGEDLHLEMVADLESTVGHTPLGNNKQALANTTALNKRVVHPKSAPVKTNKAALSFVSALKRV